MEKITILAVDFISNNYSILCFSTLYLVCADNMVKRLPSHYVIRRSIQIRMSQTIKRTTLRLRWDFSDAGRLVIDDYGTY